MPASPPDWQQCSLCQRLVPPNLITLHHLKPKHRGGKPEHRTPLCKPCHKQLHATYSNKHLDQQLSSLETLRHAPELQPFLTWVKKQKPTRNFRTLMSHTHPHKHRERRRWR